MTALVSLTTAQTLLTPQLMVTIADQVIPSSTAETQHGNGYAIGRATITTPIPPTGEGQLRDRWLNRPVEIQTGYVEDGGAERIFHGRVNGLARSWDGRGYRLKVTCRGWASLLDFESEEDIVFPANTELYEIVRSLCEMRGLPLYGGERIVKQDGVTPIRMGGNPAIDDGKTIIQKRTSPLRWILATLDTFFYEAFDRPDGMFWWQRISGEPAATPVLAFTEGQNLFSAGRDDEIDGMATWIDVEGATGTDADGIPFKIRSFPAVVPPDTGGFVTPPGFRRKPIRDKLLVTEELADEARNLAEANLGVPQETSSWKTRGTPSLMPGAVALVSSPKLELVGQSRWVLGVDHTASRGGIRTTWTSWAGGGEPLPAGIDELVIPVVTGPVHVGDEYLWHYAHPDHQGKEISFEIDIPETFTALWLEGWIHGSNSFLLGGTNTDSEVSKVESWQGEGDRPVGTGVLPVKDEQLAQRLPYHILPPTTGHKWGEKFRIPVPGRYEQGVLKVTFRSGEDRRIGAAFRFDDYEIYGVNAILSGIGYPALPGGGS